MDHSREDRNDSYTRSMDRFLAYRFPPRRRFDSISRTRFPSILSSASSFLPNPFPPWLMTSFHPGPSIDVSPTFEAFLGFWEGSQHVSSSNPLPPFLRYVRSLLPSLFPNRSHRSDPWNQGNGTNSLLPSFPQGSIRTRNGNDGNEPEGTDPQGVRTWILRLHPQPSLGVSFLPDRRCPNPHAEGDPIGPESSDGRGS